MRKLFVTSPISLVDFETSTISNVIEVDLEVLISLWSRFLNDLNTIAHSINEALAKHSSQCINRPECRAGLLADAIVSFIKHLAVVPPAPPPKNRRVPLIVHPTDLFLLYTILKRYCTYASEDEICASFRAIEELLVGRNINELPGSLDEVRKTMTSLTNVIGSSAYTLIFDPYTAHEEDHTRVCRDKSVYRLGLIRCIPADTRPGLSSSSLLVHALLTSAIARLIFESEAVVSKDLAIEVVRLAALLHDVSKSIAWYETFTKSVYVSHVSDEVLDKVWSSLPSFEKLLGSDLLMYIRALIKCHHSEDAEKCIQSELSKFEHLTKPWPIGVLAQMAKAIASADRISSAIDRLKRIIEERRSEIEKLANVKWQDIADLFADDKRSWMWLLKAEQDLVERVAKAIAQSVMSEHSLAAVDGEVIKGIAIGIADIREIQKFIDREDLRTLIGGSVAVDMITLTIIPALLVKELGLNIEHILYAGGGVVNFLIRGSSDEIKRLRDAYAELSEIAQWLPDATFVASELLNDWRATMRRLFTRLAIAKMTPSATEAKKLHLTDLGIGIRCEICGKRPAVTGIESLNVVACKSCQLLRSLGDNFYVNVKLTVLRDVGYNVPSEAVMKYLMEWLSGHRIWELGESLNIAVLYADMNLGGLFFANSLSISEAFTKSTLVDYALKKALYTALVAVRYAYGDDVLTRCYTGILYTGGDDLLAIIPSSVAPLVALYVSVVFWSIIGSRQLSIAIASAKPKQNVWNVIDTAKRLLDEAKSFVRREVKSLDELKTVVGVVTVIYSNRQLLPAHIDVVHTYRDMGLSLQPLILRIELSNGFRFRKGYNSYTTILNLFSTPRLTSVRDLLEALKDGRPVCIQASNDVEDFIREVYHIARTRSARAEVIPIIAAVYATNYYIKIRNTDFGSKLKEEFLTPLINDLGRHRKVWSKASGFFPLYDTYLIQKVLEGLTCVKMV